jgi:hypothetical protein
MRPEIAFINSAEPHWALWWWERRVTLRGELCDVICRAILDAAEELK